MRFNFTQRPAVERMHTIATLLRAEIKFSAGELATRFEVNRKTIVRDFTFMRDRLGWEITWNAKAGKYHAKNAPRGVL